MKGDFKMKKLLKLTSIIITIVLLVSVTATVSASNIPRESTPINVPQDCVLIVENLISDILDEVSVGMGYADARNKSNNLIRQAVIANETSGYGFGVLSAIANNAILEYRDIYLRPEYYKETEEKVRALISDIIVDVENGKNYNEARKEAYTRIYQSVDPGYNPEEQYLTDFCYWDVPAVDSAWFNRARKLLLEAEAKQQI